MIQPSWLVISCILFSSFEQWSDLSDVLITRRRLSAAAALPPSPGAGMRGGPGTAQAGHRCHRCPRERDGGRDGWQQACVVAEMTTVGSRLARAVPFPLPSKWVVCPPQQPSTRVLLQVMDTLVRQALGRGMRWDALWGTPNLTAA